METIRYLAQTEKQQTRTLYERAFPEDSGAFVDYYYQWKTADNRILVMEEKGRIQVMIHLNPYTFQICGVRQQIPYIVAVATWPDCRRQGKMRRLMNRLLQDLEQQKCPFAILLPADPAYYESQGFVFVPKQNEWEMFRAEPHLKAAEAEVRKSAETVRKPEVRRSAETVRKPEVRRSAETIRGLEVRKAGEADIPKLVKLSNGILQRNSQIFAVRDRAYYQRLLAETQAEQGGVLFLTSPGNIRGILVYGMEGAERPAAEIKELLQAFPAEPEELRTLCEKALPGCEISFSRPRMMVRIASLETLVSMLKSERAWSFAVKVRDSAVKANCGCFRITLNADGGKLERIPDRGELPELDISELALELLQDIYLDFREWV